MNRQERFELYKDMYFREIERIEKISARLALPFAVLVATAGLLSFMLNSAEYPDSGFWKLSFWILFSASAIFLLVGAWFFRVAWFGHSDKLLPTAHAIEEYYATLEETFKEMEDRSEIVKEEFEKFLFDYFKRFSSENAINNDRRSYNIYRALVCLTISVMSAFFAAVPFYFGRI